MIAKRVFLAFILIGMIAAVAGAQSSGSHPARQSNKVKKTFAVKPSGNGKAKTIEVNCGAGEAIL